MSLWDADVEVAMRLAVAGRGNVDIARVLAAEVYRLQGIAFGPKVARPDLQCPRCGQTADSVEKRLDGPARYRHGQVEHLDLTMALPDRAGVVRDGS